MMTVVFFSVRRGNDNLVNTTFRRLHYQYSGRGDLGRP